MESAIVRMLFFVLLPAGTNTRVVAGEGTMRDETRGAAALIFSHENPDAVIGHKCSSCQFGIFVIVILAHNRNEEN